MERYTYAEKVIEKIKKITQNNADARRIIIASRPPCVELNENLEINRIQFCGIDTLIATNVGIYIMKCSGKFIVLEEYSSFDELLKMKITPKTNTNDDGEED